MDSIPTGAGWVLDIDFIWHAYSALMANEFRDPDAIFACPDGEDATRCLFDGAAVLEMYSLRRYSRRADRLPSSCPWGYN